MTNFEKYKEGLTVEGVIEDIRRCKCSEGGDCPVGHLCNERTNCPELLKAYFRQAPMNEVYEIELYREYEKAIVEVTDKKVTVTMVGADGVNTITVIPFLK